MPTCHFLKSEASKLAAWKRRYLQQVSAPLAGMWQSFVAVAQHYSVCCANKVIGHCVINAEGKLLQFFVDHRDFDSEFLPLLLELKVQHAVVSTCG